MKVMIDRNEILGESSIDSRWFRDEYQPIVKLAHSSPFAGERGRAGASQEVASSSNEKARADASTLDVSSSGWESNDWLEETPPSSTTTSSSTSTSSTSSSRIFPLGVDSMSSDDWDPFPPATSDDEEIFVINSRTRDIPLTLTDVRNEVKSSCWDAITKCGSNVEQLRSLETAVNTWYKAMFPDDEGRGLSLQQNRGATVGVPSNPLALKTPQRKKRSNGVKGKGPYKCSRCKQFGHTKSKCRKAINPNNTVAQTSNGKNTNQTVAKKSSGEKRKKNDEKEGAAKKKKKQLEQLKTWEEKRKQK